METFKVHSHGPPRRTLWDRLWEKILLQKTTDGCWEWTGGLTIQGYGVITKGGRSGPNVLAHRAAYEMLVGPIPDGLELDHLCRNPLCCNPTHLEPVTHKENMVRSGPYRVKTHCKRGHEFTKENVRLTWRPALGTHSRSCRICERILKGYKTARKPPYTLE